MLETDVHRAEIDGERVLPLILVDETRGAVQRGEMIDAVGADLGESAGAADWSPIAPSARTACTRTASGSASMLNARRACGPVTMS